MEDLLAALPEEMKQKARPAPVKRELSNSLRNSVVLLHHSTGFREPRDRALSRLAPHQSIKGTRSSK
jgi:hypothetical protein